MKSYLPDSWSGRPHLAEHVHYWWHCARRELRFQCCADCGTYRHPPAPLCPNCRSEQSRWELAPGDAELFSYTVVHHAANVRLKNVLPYNVAIVAFPSLGGLRIVSNVIDAAPEELRIDMPLDLVWQKAESYCQLPLFKKRPPGVAIR